VVFQDTEDLVVEVDIVVVPQVAEVVLEAVEVVVVVELLQVATDL
jgi:hypothetical protein